MNAAERELILRISGKVEGNCAYCNAFLGGVAWEAGQVCALLGPEGCVVFCAKHVLAGPKSAEYKATMEAVSLAKIAQLHKQ